LQLAAIRELKRRGIEPPKPKPNLAKYQADPVGFAQEILHCSPWARQQDIMRSVAARPRTTVRSCHNSGKTYAAALLTQWFLHCFDPSLVITTATTDRQVKKQLWGEIRQQHLKGGLPGILRLQELVISPTQQALGFTTSEAEKFQGWHAANILIIVDEASGVEEPIYAAIEGCLTGPNPRLLLIGNPNNAVGTFFESFRSDLYAKGRFHLQAGDVPEFLLPASWAEERRQEWGEDSPLYQVRVLGNFPEQGEDSLISLKWAEEAQEREEAGRGTGMGRGTGSVHGSPGELGIDVARFGADETVCYARVNGTVVGSEAWRGFDTVASAGRAARMAHDYAAVTVKVDDPGIGGGVTDQLRALEREGTLTARIEAINVGQAAHDKEKFYDRRSELYWGLRERFKSGDISIPKDDVLLSQLTSLRYSYTPRGQIRVEGKDELRKRRPQGAKWQSPDRADALMLCFASSGPRWVPIAMAGEGIAVGMAGWGGTKERSPEEQLAAARQTKIERMREEW
jgi:phage terminase large subunit